MPKKIKKIIEDLIKLHENYSSTYRFIITKERYNGLVKSNILKDWDYDSEILREPLIEHIGHTPLIASYLHNHIQHKQKVDLGRALIMLSIHDIGETTIGDILAYKKTDSDQKDETNEAKKLLPNYLFDYLQEMEDQKTLDAKFAKSVDSISPLIHEMVMPEVTLKRFEKYQFGIDDIIKKKKPHFEWDNVLAEIFEYLIEKFREM